MRVAGVDSCKGGWLVVRAEANDQLHLLGVSVAPTFIDVLREARECKAVAVDIPIGLPEGALGLCARRADEEARKLLREPRRRSVFPAPIREILKEKKQPDASRRSRDLCGKGVSAQTFEIIKKIRQVDECITPALQRRVFEVHPEVSFFALNGGAAMQFKKSSADGKSERLRLLSAEFSNDLTAFSAPRMLDPRGYKVVALDDFYDACAAAWTAARYARGEAERLPADPPLDARGLRMEIVY